MEDVHAWLYELQEVHSSRSRHDVLDFMFDHIDNLLCAGEFDKVGELLDAVDMSKLDVLLVVGFLSITLRAALLLPTRPSFVARATERVRELDPERMKSLLIGLD